MMMKYYRYKAFILFLLGLFITFPLFSKQPASKADKPMIVVIDPGHGGKDPGAVNKSIREKDIVLGIGLKLGKMINENLPNVKVVYTRSTDIFIPLIERSRIANKNKADLFISIHANSGGAPSTRGTETFVLGLHRSSENLEVAKKENSVILLEDDYKTTYEGFDPNLSESYIMFELVQDVYMDQSLQFASAIQNQFTSRLETPNRGVKQAGLLVLRQSSMPSVLVEAGFLSNQAEANFLNSAEGQQSIAVSIFDAFRKFQAKNSAVSSAPSIAEKQNNADTSKQVAKASALVKSETKTEQRSNTDSGKPMTATVEKTQAQQEASVQQEKAVPQEKLESKPTENKASDESVKTGKSSDQSASAVKSEVHPQKGTDQQPVSPSTGTEMYYSVQIGANTTPVEPVPANFKGLKNVRREKTDKYYRYYVGQEVTLEKITQIWQEVKLKFPQSFLVSFANGQRTIIDNKTNP